MAMIHPVLLDLQLTKPTSKRNSNRPPRAIDILQHLLQEKVISEAQLRHAYSSIVAQADKEDSGEALAEENTISHNAKESDQEKANLTRRRHVALKFYYDGAKYSGLAQNVGSSTDQSVEKELFAALAKARLIDDPNKREGCGYSRCGRTDRGVSAAGQVVAFRLKSAFAPWCSKDEGGTELIETNDLPRNSYTPLSVWVLPRKSKPPHQKPRQQRELREYAYDKILNNLLPPDIRVLGWTPVSDEFSARFSATTRTYRYFFRAGNLNLDAMRTALQMMVGCHDFRNFCKMDVEKVYNFERVIHSATVIQEKENTDGVCYFLIVGQAFLWHQIRCIVTILFYIGQGLESPSLVTKLFDVENNPGKPAYPLADELPLVLHDCGYPSVTFGHSAENLWNVTAQSESRWEQLVLSAARLRNNTNALRNVMVSVDDVKAIFRQKVNDRNKRLPKSSCMHRKEWTDPPFSDTAHVTWGEVLDWVKDSFELTPESLLVKSGTHVPVLERHRGTTYEEKVASVQNSTKRCQKYTDNVIKKRKTKEEDAAFYKHMAKQGGTGL